MGKEEVRGDNIGRCERKRESVCVAYGVWFVCECVCACIGGQRTGRTGVGGHTGSESFLEVCMDREFCRDSNSRSH